MTLSWRPPRAVLSMHHPSTYLPSIFMYLPSLPTTAHMFGNDGDNHQKEQLSNQHREIVCGVIQGVE